MLATQVNHLRYTLSPRSHLVQSPSCPSYEPQHLSRTFRVLTTVLSIIFLFTDLPPCLWLQVQEHSGHRDLNVNVTQCGNRSAVAHSCSRAESGSESCCGTRNQNRSCKASQTLEGEEAPAPICSYLRLSLEEKLHPRSSVHLAQE